MHRYQLQKHEGSAWRLGHGFRNIDLATATALTHALMAHY